MPNKSTTRKSGNEVGSVRKALEILCQFGAEAPRLSVSELSRRLDLPKATAHSLLRTLQRYEFVKQDAFDRRYRLGPRVFELGLRFSHNTRLVALAGPHLRRLADQTKETVKLGILSNAEVLILTAIESPYQLHTRGDEGLRAPLHCTGLGKALLAELGAQEARQIVQARGLPRFTAHSITAVSRLLDELAETRKRGYALDVEEHEEGVVCAASSIRDLAHATVAALSISAPASRSGPERLHEQGALVAEAARAIAAGLKNSSVTRRKPSFGVPLGA